MFNEDKAFRVVVDNRIVGCVRVIHEARRDKIKPRVYLCVFLARLERSDPDLCSAVMQEIQYQSRRIRWDRNYLPMIVSNLTYNTIRDNYGIAVEPVRQFGSTARMRGSSVLLDEVTGKPLY